jgi:hypothetical protein
MQFVCLKDLVDHQLIVQPAHDQRSINSKTFLPSPYILVLISHCRYSSHIGLVIYLDVLN